MTLPPPPRLQAASSFATIGVARRGGKPLPCARALAQPLSIDSTTAAAGLLR
jgi:hypothetical protein